jgi:hypothetical protein
MRFQVLNGCEDDDVDLGSNDMWEVKTDVVEKHTAYIFTAEVTLKMESV